MKKPLEDLETARKKARQWIWAFSIITLLALASPASRVVVVLLPLSSFALAISLCRRHHRYYVSLVCWLFFLTPMIRRVIDWQTSSSANSIVMITPYLVCGAGLYAIRARWRELLNRKLELWHYVIAVITYGTVIGFFLNSKSALAVDAAGWMAPLCFALYLYAEREHIEELLRGFRDSFIYGVAFMSLYGLYQFFFLAPWDVYWMENSTLTSIGFPEPRQVRLFSTMNAPQPFADTLIAGILFSFASKSWVRYFSIGLGILALGLSMSRSGWIGAAAGLIFLSISFTSRQRLWLVNGLIACAFVLALVMQIPEIGQTMSDRLQSFTDLKGDGSATARLADQTYAIELFKSSPFGLGLGSGGGAGADGPSFGVAHGPEIPLADNGMEQVTLSFGWFGSLIFAFGFGATFLRSFRGPQIPELTVPKAILVAIMIQIATMGIFPGITGFMMWTLMAACEAYRTLSLQPSAERSRVALLPQASSYGASA